MESKKKYNHANKDQRKQYSEANKDHIKGYQKQYRDIKKLKLYIPIGENNNSIEIIKFVNLKI